MLSKIVAYALAAIGTVIAGGASMGCIVFFLDEPEMPSSMINN